MELVQLGQYSGRCDCRNDHSSNSGRCNTRNVRDMEARPEDAVYCEACKRDCCGVNSMASGEARFTTYALGAWYASRNVAASCPSARIEQEREYWRGQADYEAGKLYALRCAANVQRCFEADNTKIRRAHSAAARRMARYDGSDNGRESY